MKTLLKVPYYFLMLGVVATGSLLLLNIMPMKNGVVIKIVKSGSMEPSIKTGSIVLIKHQPSYGIGDVITFGKDTKQQIPTTHRIISEEGIGASKVFVTKGDANDAPDPAPVDPKTISGKVIFSIPYIGYILDFTKKPVGFLLVVGLPALIIIIDEITKILKEIKRIKKVSLATSRTNDRNIIKKSNILDLRGGIVSRKSEISHVPRYYRYFKIKILFLAFITTASLLTLSPIENTISFYKENESSISNMFRASSSFIEDAPFIELQLVQSEAFSFPSEEDIPELMSEVLEEDTLHTQSIEENDNEIIEESLQD